MDGPCLHCNTEDRIGHRCICEASDLRARVARLEAANAALREYATHKEDCRYLLSVAYDFDCTCGLAAALSDTGEGWLPPEVTSEMVRLLRLSVIEDHTRSCPGHRGRPCSERCKDTRRALRRLGALEVT